MPYVLSSSDDMSMKLWNWDQNWDCISSFEGETRRIEETHLCCCWEPRSFSEIRKRAPSTKIQSRVAPRTRALRHDVQV